ncbi:MAG: helix-turn-helix transcriptional regulator [Actinomycetota bacterium]
MDTVDPICLARVRQLAASGEAKATRLRSGLSLREVAAGVGVSDTTVLRWEGGTHAPHGEAAVAYLGVLDQLAGVDADPARGVVE